MNDPAAHPNGQGLDTDRSDLRQRHCELVCSHEIGDSPAPYLGLQLQRVPTEADLGHRFSLFLAERQRHLAIVIGPIHLTALERTPDPIALRDLSDSP